MSDIYREKAEEYYENINKKIMQNKRYERFLWIDLIKSLLHRQTIQLNMKNEIEFKPLDKNIDISTYYQKIWEEYEEILKEKMLSEEHIMEKHINPTLIELVKRVIGTFNGASAFLFIDDDGKIKSFWDGDDVWDDATYELMGMFENEETLQAIADIFSGENKRNNYNILEKGNYAKIRISKYFGEEQPAIGVTKDLELAETISSVLFLRFNNVTPDNSGIKTTTFYPDLYGNSKVIDYNLKPAIAEALFEESYEPNKMFWLIKQACVGIAASAGFEKDGLAFHCEPYFTLETQNTEYKRVHHFVIDIPGDDMNKAYQIKISIPKNGNELTNPKLFIGTRDENRKFYKDETKCGKNGLPLIARNKDKPGYFSLIDELRGKDDESKKKIGDSFIFIQKVTDAINESRELCKTSQINEILNFLSEYDPEKMIAKEAIEKEKYKIAVKEMLEKYQNKENAKSVEENDILDLDDLDKIFETNIQNTMFNTSKNDISEDAR